MSSGWNYHDPYSNEEGWGPWIPVKMTPEMIAEDKAMLLRINQMINPEKYGKYVKSTGKILEDMIDEQMEKSY